MKKTISIILLIVTIATLALSIVTNNAEIWGIKPDVITIISSIILAIKEFVQGIDALTPQEAADFANEHSGSLQSKSSLSDYSADEVVHWKKNRL